MKKSILTILAVFMIFTACAQGSADKSSTSSYDGETKMTQKLYITVNGEKISATLVDNSSTQALVEKLKSGSITYEAHDYGNFEKVGNLPWSLPTNDTDISTDYGDLILYLGKSFVIYYDKNEWDFTRLGKVDNLSQSELKTFLNAGNGNVSVTLSLE